MMCFGGDQDGGGWGELKKVRPPQPSRGGMARSPSFPSPINMYAAEAFKSFA